MSPDANGPNAQDRATHSSDNVTLLLDSISIGREEGNNSRPGHEDATRDLSTTGDNPLGTGEPTVESLQISLGIDANAKMNLIEIEERFNQATRMGLKPSSQRYYLNRFRRMAKVVSLESYSKRQLAGPVGKRLILDYITTVSKPSVRIQLEERHHRSPLHPAQREL